jgi:tripartite-type tricarboxylate transporter receptor subunit TctC
MMKHAAVFTLLMGASLAVTTAAAAAPTAPPWSPTKPVRILHGFQPGGPPDLVLRQIATRLEARIGQPVVVENRPGASGTIAAGSVARSAPDGQTLLFGVAANLAVAPAMMSPPPYDPVKAFTPIVEVARGPYVWIVRADAPARNLAEFKQWAHASAERLNYASPGIGSAHHLATEMFKSSSAIDMVHVPYKGGMYPGLLAGDVHAMFESMPSPLPYLQAGKIRILGVTGPRRLAVLPDVPTFVEQGLADVDANSWWGFVGPAGLPAPIVDRFNAEIGTILGDSTLSEMLGAWGIQATPGSPASFAAYLEEEAGKWRDRIARFGVKPE